jgi:hypothetical protein
MLTGIKDVIVCNLFQDTSTHRALSIEAYKALVGAYPKLFNCVTDVDFDTGEITVNYHEHYAVVYNVLRLLNKFRHTGDKAYQAMIDNPALSLFIIDFYEYGSRSVDEAQVFTVSAVDHDVINAMVKKRDWFLTDSQRIAKVNNASLRDGCEKRVCKSYVKIVDPTAPRNTSIHTNYKVPAQLHHFINEYVPEELRGAA